jgi:hypothetical protein
MHILAGGQAHIDRILLEAKTKEGLKPELIQAFVSVVAGWKAPVASETLAAASSRPSSTM